MRTNEKLLHCSFCGKSQHEVIKLIAGPSVFICDECVGLCNDILEEPQDKEGKALTSCRLCRNAGEADEMLKIPERGFLCETCMSVAYEEIRQWYLKA